MEDESIVKLFLERSESAIDETEKKYGKYCRTIVNNILSSKEDTNECVNDVYMSVWNSIPPNIPEHFKAFIGKIARNHALNRYKFINRGKRNSGQINAVLSELSECTDSSLNVEKEIESRLLTEEITGFLKNTDAVKRKIFVQRYWYIMSLKDISEQNSIKENQVKSILFRMRSELKKYLKAKELL